MSKNKKYFIITIDTEGDNLWLWKDGNPITTKNVMYLDRFQNLCNKYGFKPVWLTNYEMIMDPKYVKFINDVISTDSGELGMHLHAWNSPPLFELEKCQNGAPYLIEYPVDVMENKIKYLTDLIVEKTGVQPITHRAGRWAMNQSYFDILSKYGYKVDCSVTPHVNWRNSAGQTRNAKGSDYSNSDEKPFYVNCGNNRLLEVPVTIRRYRTFVKPQSFSIRNLFAEAYHCMKKRVFWMRPKKNNLNQLLNLADYCSSEKDSDYLMFMIHSSEFMPGGSPTFISSDDIELLYKDMEILFERMARDYHGVTLREYYNLFESR